MTTIEQESKEYMQAFAKVCREIKKTEAGKNLTTEETVMLAAKLIYG